MNEEQIARLLDAIETLSRRVESIEASRADTKPDLGDAEEGYYARRVVADADAETITEGLMATQKLRDDLRRREAALDRKMVAARPLTHDDFRVLGEVQARADNVFSALGLRAAPAPWATERPLAYRARLAGELSRYSPSWKGIGRFDSFDEKTFALAEKQIYADAEQEAKKPINVPAGQLREVTKVSPGGHKVSEFFGESFIRSLKPPTQIMRIVDPRETKLRELVGQAGF